MENSQHTVAFCILLPTRRNADPALVGLLTSELLSPGLLVADATMARESGEAYSLSYSGGDRPGIAPASLFVGLPRGGPTTNANNGR